MEYNEIFDTKLGSNGAKKKTFQFENTLASVGVTPRSKQLGVTPRTPLFEGKNPENQKLKISIK